MSLRSVSRPPVVEMRASTPSGTVMTMFDAPAFTRTGTSPDGLGSTSRSVDAPVLTPVSVTRTSERSTSNSPAPALKSSDVGTSLAIRGWISVSLPRKDRPRALTCSIHTSTPRWFLFHLQSASSAAAYGSPFSSPRVLCRLGAPARCELASPPGGPGERRARRRAPSTLARAGAASPPHPRDSDALRRLSANSPTCVVRPGVEGGAAGCWRPPGSRGAR